MSKSTQNQVSHLHDVAQDLSDVGYFLYSVSLGDSEPYSMEAILSPRVSAEQRKIQETICSYIESSVHDNLVRMQRAAHERSRLWGWILCVEARRGPDTGMHHISEVSERVFAKMEAASADEVPQEQVEGYTIAAVAVSRKGIQRASKKLKNQCKLALVEISDLKEHIRCRMARMQKNPENTNDPQHDLDLKTNRLPKHQIPPEEMEERIRKEYSEYATAYPERAKDFAQILVQDAEALGLLSRSRTLGLREAARRIANRIGDDTFSGMKLRRYFDSHYIKIGDFGEDGLPKFSEYECETFVPPPNRQRGPKPHEPEKDSKQTA